MDEGTKGFIKPSSTGSKLTGVRGFTSGLGDFTVKIFNHTGKKLVNLPTNFLIHLKYFQILFKFFLNFEFIRYDTLHANSFCSFNSKFYNTSSNF